MELNYIMEHNEACFVKSQHMEIVDDHKNGLSTSRGKVKEVLTEADA